MTSHVPPGFYEIELNKTVWCLPDRYQNPSPVGCGAYGQVCSAQDTKINNQKVAIKKLARPFQSSTHAKRTYRELRMLKHMNHENVIGLLDTFTPMLTPSLEGFEDVYMVTPLMGADLNNIIKTQKLSDEHVQFLIYQILRGLKYIHSAGIIHRDLKPSNIAVNEDCELRILDFGLARPTETEMTGYVATRWYRAPEIMLNWMHYNQTVDIWSVGCIFAECLTGKVLFPGTDRTKNIYFQYMQALMPEVYLLISYNINNKAVLLYINQLNLIMDLLGKPDKTLDRISSEPARHYIRSLPTMKKKDFKEVFKGANPLAIDLLEKMLELDSEERITAELALAHPYLSQYADSSDEPISTQYDQSFEDMEAPLESWRQLVYEEVVNFKPPPPLSAVHPTT